MHVLLFRKFCFNEGYQTYSIPSRFSHQSSDCAPLNSRQLSCFQVGKRVFETETKLIVSLEERPGRQDRKVVILHCQKQFHNILRLLLIFQTTIEVITKSHQKALL